MYAPSYPLNLVFKEKVAQNTDKPESCIICEYEKSTLMSNVPPPTFVFITGIQYVERLRQDSVSEGKMQCHYTCNHISGVVVERELFVSNANNKV